MPKYRVNVVYHCAYDKDLEIYASDEEEAEEKAIEIVENWKNVVDAETTEIEEI